MNSYIDQILTKIASDNRDVLADDSRNYKEVDMSKTAAELGFSNAEDYYYRVNAIVPLKTPVEGMKVRIDGRTFVNYVQFDSGIVVPNHVAKQTDLPYREYVAQDSMILNFT